MHAYRTHYCGDLRLNHVGQQIRLSGWIHRKRDHGNLLFIDLRDASGLSQCVIDSDNPHFLLLEKVRVESVMTVTGRLAARTDETINQRLPTGSVELEIETALIQSEAELLPLQVASAEVAGEESRLRYRFLDLRREHMQQNIHLRAAVIGSIRQRMIAQGFIEIQTPILTASSPEGARDFLVPSRLHPGRFYALPQAPQQFKQLLMISGFDRYFQIAPCFRDEDSRADRSPGEFYQLDFEMSFVTQEDVFAALEPVLVGLFSEFADFRRDSPWAITQAPFPRIPYEQALLTYGTDKPDLRNPLQIIDVSDLFADDLVDFKAFKNIIAKGGVVRAIPGPGASNRPRAWFDKLNAWARAQGAAGLGYIQFRDGAGSGPIAKFIPETIQAQLRRRAKLQDGDAVFFVCDQPGKAATFAGQVRNRLGIDLDLCEKAAFRFCWIVDFPMFERDSTTGQMAFSHNPFSMPQGGMAALETQDPETIKAWQYDIVCNGVELSSGAIRNHLPEVMLKAFAIAGYGAEEVEQRFGGMLAALRFGAPPHGGSAPGLDRIVMLLANEQNLREIVAFPMNQQACDLLMHAPNEVPPERLRELHIRVQMPPKTQIL